MKKILRLIFVVLFLPPFILLLISAAIGLTMPQKQLRTLLASQIGQKIHRQIMLGPMRLRWNGISIATMKVSETPSFNAGVFFEAKDVRIGWSLRSLWEGLDLRQRAMTRSSGNFFIKEFRNPHYHANDFSIEWSLRDITSAGNTLNGWAKLKQGTGTLRNIDVLMARTPSAKAAFMPVQALTRLERGGVLKLGLPDLQNWPLDSIAGNYHFENGLMTIKEFVILSAKLNLSTQGTVNLATGQLGLDAMIHAPKSSGSGVLDATFHIAGTTTNPKVDLSSLRKKAFQATVTNLLKNPAKAKKDINEALKSLFK